MTEYDTLVNMGKELSAAQETHRLAELARRCAHMGTVAALYLPEHVWDGLGIDPRSGAIYGDGDTASYFVVGKRISARAGYAVSFTFKTDNRCMTLRAIACDSYDNTEEFVVRLLPREPNNENTVLLLLARIENAWGRSNVTED